MCVVQCCIVHSVIQCYVVLYSVMQWMVYCTVLYYYVMQYIVCSTVFHIVLCSALCIVQCCIVLCSALCIVQCCIVLYSDPLAVSFLVLCLSCLTSWRYTDGCWTDISRHNILLTMRNVMLLCPAETNQVTYGWPRCGRPIFARHFLSWVYHVLDMNYCVRYNHE